jgi:DNA-binding beta-propeller fold protein YncE
VDHRADGSIFVLDIATRAVSAIGGLDWPGTICVSPTGHEVYCLYDEVMMCVVDGDGDSIVTTLHVGPSPCCLLYINSGNKLYCSNDWDGYVTVLATDPVRVSGTIPTLTHPMGLCYNADENKVYNNSSCCNGLCVIDASRDSVVAEFSLPDPVGLCYNGKTRTAYVSCWDGERLVMIDGQTNQVVGELPLTMGPTGLCLDEGNNKLYCRSGNHDSVAVIDCRADTVARRFGTGRGPTAMAWNPQQSRVYVANWSGASISVFRDSLVPGVADRPDRQRLPDEWSVSTILRGPELTRRDCRVIDALGRDVTDRRERLAPGVYFLRPAAVREPSTVRKVIVQR